ncbi:hypothetical protein DAPPUDRAFT_239426 [Daphnia pulex]|uniref:Uncharacterized protein n=1 Tax=Daphnia pulex TaxID=6669 RepID=E9G9A7_DAPPU|nr:hypothetical protein DAPPUDRAFT_239426 [Daphnia pulex]|eukprot:EFX84104.1 hypothetical protein DAPPUDRAFT_239426 [Daphnia pulex]
MSPRDAPTKKLDVFFFQSGENGEHTSFSIIASCYTKKRPKPEPRRLRQTA